MKPLTIGLVGFGRMGRDHARMLAELSGVDVAIVVEPHAQNLKDARAFFAGKAVTFYADLGSALLAPKVDGWIVSSSTHSHVPVARVLLQSGATILLEKPIAESQSDALELEEFVHPDSSNLMMGHILLWSDEFNSLLSKVKEKGEKEISAMRERTASHRIDYRGESPFSLLMVHDLYCIQALTDCAEPTSISGMTFTHAQGGEDCGLAYLEWADGSRARAESNYFIPDDAAIAVEDELTVRGNGWQESITSHGDFEGALRNELLHFLSLLRSEVKVPIGARFSDAVQVQGWVDKLIASAQQAKGE